MLDNLWLGLTTALSIHALTYAFVGVLIGNLIGVLPGIGALAAIAMLLPMTYSLDPTGALMMLAGLYYGTSFGGATTSILLNLPGTAQHAVVCLDGHQLALKGRAGPAIFMAMFASCIGVIVGIIMMTFLSPLVVSVAFKFGPAEYFSLMLLGLLAASVLTTGSPIKGIIGILFGLICGTIGTDLTSGAIRFTFGLPGLIEGLSIVALAMALFGVTEVYKNAGILKSGDLISKDLDRRSVRPNKKEMKQSAGAIARGSIIGSVLGALPGTGGVLGSFMSYAAEKKLDKDPQRFGQGAIEGVAGPEAANSSAAITAFIPTLTLGIPGDAVMALMMGALMIHNIIPGPQLITEHASLFWGLIMSFWIGNLMLLVLNIPLIGIWIKLLTIPYRWIYPIVLFLISVGVYSTNNNLTDVGVVTLFGVLGYLAARLGYEPAPIILGLVLGPLMEQNFRRALKISHGDLSVFIYRPISASFLLIIVLLLTAVLVINLRKKRLKKR